MQLDKKIEIVFYDKKLFPIKLGYSLGTVYTIDVEDMHKFKLYNFGYCPSTKDFYYNRAIRLPKLLIEHFEDRYINREILENEMKELGIYKKNDVDGLLNDYNDARMQSEMTREKTLRLKRSLKAKR